MQQFIQAGMLFDQRLQECRIGSVTLPHFSRPARWPRLTFAVAPAVQTQIGRRARALRKSSHQRRLIHRVFRHFTVGRPFAATDAHQPRLRYRHAVVARQRRRVLHLAHLAQRPQPREGAQDVARLGVLGEIPGRVREQKLDFFGQRTRFKLGFGNRRVGRADKHTAVPGDREKDTPIIGLRNHDGAVTGQEGLVEDQMNALAGSDHRFRIRLVHSPHGIGKDARRIDDDTCVQFMFLAAFEFFHRDAAHQIVLLHQRNHRHVVDQHGARIGRRLRQADREPGIIELPVIINSAALKPVRFERRQAPQRLFAREMFGRAEAKLAREQIIDFQTDPVKWRFPPGVVRHDEREVIDQVRRVLGQQAPLAQRLQHQADVALLQVADPAVNQLGAAADVPFAKSFCSTSAVR